MFRLLVVFLLTCCLSSLALATTITHVIYITFDGTRWQDVLVERTHFPILWGKYAKALTVYGAPGSRTSMYVATVPTSLPSYLSQTSGSIQACVTNDCGRIHAQTFLENMLIKMGLYKKDVATFASWTGIGLATESVLGVTYTNAGNVPVVDPDTQAPDDVMAAINTEQAAHGAGDGDRFDQYTFAQAMHYFEKFTPRFMWIALNDADTQAHIGNLEGYHKVLDAYDGMLDTLFTKLKAMHLDEETLVIVTTDHGRGSGDNWITHGILHPESMYTWALVKNGKLKEVFFDGYTHYYNTLSIRPTIESALRIK